MLDLAKVRNDLYEKAMKEAENDENKALDDFLVSAMEYCKKVPRADKLAYAKENPQHLLEALQEMQDKSVIDQLLTEMLFMQLH
jgi:ribosomal protein L10